MKRDQWRESPARQLQNLAHLQRVETARLKTDANLQCTVAHKVEACLGNDAARTLECSIAQINLHTAICQKLTRRFAILIDSVQIRSNSDQ